MVYGLWNIQKDNHLRVRAKLNLMEIVVPAELEI